jgi:hypothetical protein
VLAGGILLLSNRRLVTDLTALRGENKDLREEKAVLRQAAVAKAGRDSEELSRLKKEVDAAALLRAEVSQLQDQRRSLDQQIQIATSRAQAAEQQARASGTQVAVLQTEIAQARAQTEALRAIADRAKTSSPPAPREQALPKMDAAAAAEVCVRNLQRIDAAKLQWAMEQWDRSSDSPTMEDLGPFLQHEALRCPAGGAYTANPISALPTCSQPGHSISKP